MAIVTVLLFDIFKESIFCNELPNGLRYLRWGGDGDGENDKHDVIS
jgi:hypothetical protein